MKAIWIGAGIIIGGLVMGVYGAASGDADMLSWCGIVVLFGGIVTAVGLDRLDGDG